MLQRIQTIYLILAAVITGVLPFIFPLWKEQVGTEIVDFYFMKEIGDQNKSDRLTRNKYSHLAKINNDQD